MSLWGSLHRHSQGAKGPCPQKFLERSHFALKEAFFQTNSVIRLKSDILPPPNFWAGYAIDSLEKDTDRMFPSSPRQTWSSNLNHIASQLFQVASPRADQRRLM